MNFRSKEHAANEALIAVLWPEFEALVPDDEVGLEIVFKALSLLGLVRCKCGSSSVSRQDGCRTFTCVDCRAKVWFTADTLFYKVKQFKAWLGSIWLMENGAAVASSRLAQLADIAQATAHNIQKKVRLVIENCIGEEAPSLASTLFISILTKRSRSSLPNVHPDEELSNIDLDSDDANYSAAENADDSSFSSGQQRFAENNFFDLDENESAVFSHISDSPISFDSLTVLTGLSVGLLSSVLIMLELKGRVGCRDGDFYFRSRQSSGESRQYKLFTNSMLELIKAVNHYMWSIHHGVSFKWLQSFLAMTWFYCDKVRWQRGSLLIACLKSGPIDTDAVRKTQSARSVFFPSIFSACQN